MKKLLLLIAVFSMSLLFADDARVFKIGGSVGKLADSEELYQLGQDDDIVMTAEHVLITMYDDYYTVDARFWLKNEGKEKTVSIGFPEHAGELEDFCSYVNGKKVDIAKYADSNAEGLDLEANWYVKQVRFLESQTNITQITYSSRYGIVNSGLYFGIDGELPYVYGTGKSWKDSIGKITVDVKNLSNRRYVMGYRFLNKKYGTYSSDGSSFKKNSDDTVSFRWISPDTFRIEAKNIEPKTSDEYLYVYLHSFEYQDTAGFLSYYTDQNPINARCKFTSDFIKHDLSFMTESQLRLARNDFYALHGRKFSDRNLRSFYESINGYKVSKDYSDDLLSEEEKQIINRIIEIESGRKNTQ